MAKNNFKRLLAATAATVAFGATAHAQSADALIDKLVEKGILTTKEAQDLRDDSDKNFSQAYAIKSGMNDWVQALKFNGDMRTRYEMFDGDNPAFTKRSRFRFRLRFGVVAQLTDNFETGFRFISDESGGTGFGGDPLTGNETLSHNGDKKLVYLDTAYGKWTPLSGPNWLASFTIGKMDNPFVFSDLVFDPDYTPEGLAANLGYNINDKHSLKLNLAYFVLNEFAGEVNDPAMLGAQVRWDANWTSKLSTSVGLAYLSIANADLLTNSVVPNEQRGNTRDANGTLIYGYRPVVADASATYTLSSFPMYADAFPIRIGGDYMYNPGAPGFAGNYGYSAGIQFGKAGKKGTWELSYTWKWLGANAWWEELEDDDFGAFYQQQIPNDGFDSASNPLGAGYGSGTNVKGHIVKFAYSPNDAFTLSVKWFLTQLIVNYPAGENSRMSRLQMDATWKF